MDGGYLLSSLALEDFVLSCFPAIDWLGIYVYMLVIVNNLPICWGKIILLLTFSADMDTLDVQIFT